jgi:2-phospho-L-lactate transferase/gluconeogenesis factor (CofD/UPF0052 family)
LVTVLYAGVEINPILDHMAKVIKPDKLTILIDTVFDYTNADNIKIYPTLLTLLKSLATPPMEENSCLTDYLNKIGYLDFKLSDCDIFLTLLMSLNLEKEKSIIESIEEIREKLNIKIPIFPLTQLSHNLEITIDHEGERKIISPLDYYRKNFFGKITDIFFGNLDENDVTEEAKKSILKSNVFIICQPDPLALFAILNNPNIKKLFEEYPGKIVAITQSKLNQKQIKIMEALGQSPTIFGLINMYLNLVDILILDEKDTELVVKASAQELGMEIVPIDLDTSTEEKHVKILRKIFKVINLDQNEFLIAGSKTEKIKQSISSTADSIKSGLKKIKNRFTEKKEEELT